MGIWHGNRRQGVAVRLAAGAAVVAIGATACADGGAAATGTAAPPASAPSEDVTDTNDTTDTADADDAPETTIPSDDPAPSAPAAGFGAACRPVVVELLQSIEPFVDGFAAEDLMEGNLDADGLSAATAAVEERLAQECPEMHDPDVYEMMIDLARTDAPGTVWYLEALGAVDAARRSGG